VTEPARLRAHFRRCFQGARFFFSFAGEACRRIFSFFRVWLSVELRWEFRSAHAAICYSFKGFDNDFALRATLGGLTAKPRI
jgi:hypothetical protein